MSTIRMPEDVHARVHHYLFSQPGEHFAFLRARVSVPAGTPIFLVHDAALIPDGDVTVSKHGWELDPNVLVGIVNEAIRAGDALIEVHNHGGSTPRPSRLDREQLAEFVPYMLDSLNGRPYAMTVWGDSTIYGESFRPGDTATAVRSITATGVSLKQLVSRDDDRHPISPVFNRQQPWFTDEGQRALARLRIAVVGAGGTGSQVLLQLPYLGARDIAIIDHDTVDTTSLNRTVTATLADLDTHKGIAARRVIRSIAPDAKVTLRTSDLREADTLDLLKAVDVIIGCVDNDGARLVLNDLAVAYAIPYLDLGVGIDAHDGNLREAGGRLAAVVPGGPCLLCMDEIDTAEARYFLASPEQQAEQRDRRYITGIDVPAPSVVSLNGSLASAALNELALYISGQRPINPLTEFDLLGTARSVSAQWAVPQRVARNSGCTTCATAGRGDAANVDRYRLPR